MMASRLVSTHCKMATVMTLAVLVVMQTTERLALNKSPQHSGLGYKDPALNSNMHKPTECLHPT